VAGVVAVLADDRRAGILGTASSARRDVIEEMRGPKSSSIRHQPAPNVPRLMCESLQPTDS
jgi:hypothetical protein